MRACICVHACVCACLCVCVPVCVRACVCACMCVCVPVCVHAYVCMPVSVCAHVCMRAYVCMPVSVPVYIQCYFMELLQTYARLLLLLGGEELEPVARNEGLTHVGSRGNWFAVPYIWHCNNCILQEVRILKETCSHNIKLGIMQCACVQVCLFARCVHKYAMHHQHVACMCFGCGEWMSNSDNVIGTVGY